MTIMFEATSEVVPQRVGMKALADYLANQGREIVESGGVFWASEERWGFYGPLHRVWRFRSRQIQRPRWSALAYVAVLSSADRWFANGGLGVHLLVDPQAFDVAKLPETRRRNLKKCRRQVQIERLRDPELIARDGFAVHESAMRRTGYGLAKHASREGYREFMVERVSDPRRIVLCGLIDGRLVGYLEGWILENQGFDTAYINTVTLHSNHLTSQVGTGLVVDFIQICKRLPSVAEIVYGYKIDGDPALDTFKLGIGFPVCRLPSRIWILGPGRHLIRHWMPSRYHRYTGDFGQLLDASANLTFQTRHR